jgi:hypothetical protein
MSKTEQTRQLERALEAASRQKREYGCTEVTIGFRHDGHGDEIVDYMSMDAREVFRCYELKVSYADLKTDNRLSWYGDYNYLVVSEDMYRRPLPYDNYIPPYAGILVGPSLRTVRPAKKEHISDEVREMLKDSLLRSVYWKMVQWRDEADDTVLKETRAQLEEAQTELAEVRKQDDLMRFNYEDYETWYRKNRQDMSFSIAEAARQERKNFALRQEGKLTWQKQEDRLVCPVCHHEALFDENGRPMASDYCPYCGTDLRCLAKK